MRYLWLACLLALSPAWAAQLDGEVTFTPAELEAMKGDPGQDGQDGIDGTTISFGDSVCTAEVNGQTVSWGCTTDSQPPPIDPPDPPDPGPPLVGDLLGTNLIEGPVGTPVYGFCGDRDSPRAALNMTQDLVFADSNDLILCGEPFAFKLNNGNLINAVPPLIPNGNPGDVIVLGPGAYTSTVNCGGRQVSWCANGNEGVAIVGSPGAVVHNKMDGGTENLANVSMTMVEFAPGVPGPSMGRAGHRDFYRIIGNNIRDVNSVGNSGAFGEAKNTSNYKFSFNRSINTGVPGQNNAHSIYHGGVGTNTNNEYGYNTVINHVGGRAMQFYGHKSGETMSGLKVHHNAFINAQGNACLLVSHTDDPNQRSTPPDDRTWIYDFLLELNYCDVNNIDIRGAKLPGPGAWRADRNEAPLNSRQGGNPSDWIIVTNNDGAVTGNTR